MSWGFVGGAYGSQSPFADAQRLVNWYVEPLESGTGRVRRALYPTPGLSSFSTLTTPGSTGTRSSPATTPEYPEAVRGLFAHDGRLFGVAGNTLYEIDSAGTRTVIQSLVLKPSRTPVHFATSGVSGRQLAFDIDGVVYVMDMLTGVLTSAITDVAYIGYVDGYFIGLNLENNGFRISNLLQGNTWDASDAAQRLTAGDRWKRIFTANRLVYCFGSESSEIWVNTGGTFPFAPYQGSLIQYGIETADAVAEIDNAVMWLACNKSGGRVVLQARGTSVKKISTMELDTTLAGYSSADDAVAFTLQHNGHSWWVLSIPSQNATWVYDLATDEWFEWLWWERNSLSQVTGQYAAHLASCHAYCFGKHFVGSRVGPSVYWLTDAVSLEGSYTIRRLRRSPYISNRGRQLSFMRADLILETGNPDYINGRGNVDPTVMLRWSDGGARTWSQEKWKTIGGVGNQRGMVTWTNLGLGHQRCFELVCSDPVPWRILELELDVRPTRF